MNEASSLWARGSLFGYKKPFVLQRCLLYSITELLKQPETFDSNLRALV